MRTAFIEQLILEARKNPRVFLITGDLGYSVLEPYQNEFPERFLNAGIAEQNMTGIAAGLALQGFIVFTYSIGNFPTLRCMEQIRYDICYHNLNVKIIAVGGGYSYASLGTSHHATEEIGMLRSLPNMLVSAPGDPIETKLVTSAIVKHNGPAYIRLGKAGEPNVHNSIRTVEIGQAIKVLNGRRVAVLSTGSMLKYAFDNINSNEFGYSLYSFPFIKPLDSETLKHIAKEYNEIITIEEHQRNTGFGSAILEVLHDLLESNELEFIPKVRRIAIPNMFIDVAGTQDHLRRLSGLIF